MIPTDYLLASIAGNFILTAAWAVTLINFSDQRRRARRAERKNETLNADRDFLRGKLDEAHASNLELAKANFHHEKRAADRRERLRAAGKIGAQVTNAAKARQRKDAQAKTHAELAASLGKMRSRAQVVAPVKAKRTKAKRAQNPTAAGASK